MYQERKRKSKKWSGKAHIGFFINPTYSTSIEYSTKWDQLEDQAIIEIEADIVSKEFTSRRFVAQNLEQKTPSFGFQAELKKHFCFPRTSKKVFFEFFLIINNQSDLLKRKQVPDKGFEFLSFLLLCQIFSKMIKFCCFLIRNKISKVKKPWF